MVSSWMPTSPSTTLTTASLAVPASVFTNITDCGLSVSANVLTPCRAVTVSRGAAGATGAAGTAAGGTDGPGSLTTAPAGSAAATVGGVLPGAFQLSIARTTARGTLPFFRRMSPSAS